MFEPVSVVNIMHGNIIIGNGSQIFMKSVSDIPVNQAVLAKKATLRNADVNLPPPHNAS